MLDSNYVLGNIDLKRNDCGSIVLDSPSDFGAGGLRVAQFVRILLLPSHCPFMVPMAISAS